MLRRFLSVIGTCTLLGLPLAAQERSASVELGAATLRQTEGQARTVMVGSARGRLALPMPGPLTTWVGGDVAGTLAPDSVSALQGAFSLQVIPAARALDWWRTEASMGAVRFDFQQLGGGSNRHLSLRQHIEPSRRVGGFITAERGWSERQRLPFRSEAVGVTVWSRVGPATAWVGAQRAWTNDVRFADPVLHWLSRAPARFDETRLGVNLSRGRADLTLGGVRRRGTLSIKGEGGEARLGWRFGEHVSAELSHARQLGDVVRGYPEVRLSAVTLRASGAVRFVPLSLRPLPGGGGQLVVRVKGEGPFEMAGSFTDWAPLPMTRVKGAWEATVRVPAGEHRVTVRAVGGAWQAPRGLPRERDEFGGERGVVVVP